jgi:hypothetical protein
MKSKNLLRQKVNFVQTSSGAHPASYKMGTGGPFPRAKRGRGVTLTTHPHLVSRSRMSRSYISSHPSATMACSGTALLFLEGRLKTNYREIRYEQDAIKESTIF